MITKIVQIEVDIPDEVGEISSEALVNTIQMVLKHGLTWTLPIPTEIKVIKTIKTPIYEGERDVRDL